MCKIDFSEESLKRHKKKYRVIWQRDTGTVVELEWFDTKESAQEYIDSLVIKEEERRNCRIATAYQLIGAM